VTRVIEPRKPAYVEAQRLDVRVLRQPAFAVPGAVPGKEQKVIQIRDSIGFRYLNF
jgi:hypothetical protein